MPRGRPKFDKVLRSLAYCTVKSRKLAFVHMYDYFQAEIDSNIYKIYSCYPLKLSILHCKKKNVELSTHV